MLDADVEMVIFHIVNSGKGHAELYFIILSHLDIFIGTKRSNGFFVMIDHVNKYLVPTQVSGAIPHRSFVPRGAMPNSGFF